jgi:hypothetical protein
MLGLPAYLTHSLARAHLYIALTVVLLWASPSSAKHTHSNADLIKTAALLCKSAQKPVNVDLFGAMLMLEDKHNVPAQARGITLAAACRESGFRANGKRGDGGLAVGILQMWPWWESEYPFKRTQALKAVDVWLKHINRVTKKARRKCARPWRAWLVAQAWTSSGPKGWTCRYSRHYSLLLRWNRHIYWKLRRSKSLGISSIRKSE